jgi:hypothetical protein
MEPLSLNRWNCENYYIVEECTQPSKTILDTISGTGNFNGKMTGKGDLFD